MTNGTLNKMIIKAAKTYANDPATLLQHARGLMNRFPLSSNHLLYDSDQKKVPAEAWPILLKAAVETDALKLDDCNRLRAEAGIKPDKTFGRVSRK